MISMDYALIENGLVVNVISMLPSNETEFDNAVPLGEVPAGIGDTWDGEHFYRDGERILSRAEMDAQTIAAYENAITQIEKALGVNA